MTKKQLQNLKSRIRKRKPCRGTWGGALRWARGKTWEEILKQIPIEWLFWLLEQGFSEFFKSPVIENLSGYDWSWLLIEQPQFAGHCDWEKLSGNNWANLLYYQPQFAKHCDWGKLDGGDWSYLLGWQPQFAKYRTETREQK